MSVDINAARVAGLDRARRLRAFYAEVDRHLAAVAAQRAHGAKYPPTSQRKERKAR